MKDDPAKIARGGGGTEGGKGGRENYARESGDEFGEFFKCGTEPNRFL